MDEQSIRAKPAKQGIYRSYLLRLWCLDQSGTSTWRASLEDPQTSERIGFSCLEELFTFLMDQVSASDRCA
ncbi:MAG: hypothetical protein ACM3JD_16830 [Rudaea sp.]